MIKVAYLCFKRFEPGHESPFSLSALLLLIPSLLAVVLRLRFFSDLLAVAIAFSAHYTLLLIYTAIYRLSPLHPLAQYPGPILPRLSKWYSTYICKTGRLHLWYQRLHDQYGDVVRVGTLTQPHLVDLPTHTALSGPNELSIRDATAIPAVLDVGGLPKGPCKWLCVSATYKVRRTDGRSKFGTIDPTLLFSSANAMLTSMRIAVEPGLVG